MSEPTPELPTPADLPRLVSRNTNDIGALYDLLHQVDTKVGVLDTKVGVLDTKVGALDTKVTAGMDRLDGRMDGLDAKVTEILELLRSR